MKNNKKLYSHRKSIIGMAFAIAAVGALSVGLSESGLFDGTRLPGFGGDYVESEVSYSTCPEDRLIMNAQWTDDGKLKAVTPICTP